MLNNIILFSTVACLIGFAVWFFYKILVLVEIVDDRLRSIERVVSFISKDLCDLARKSASERLKQK